MQTLTSKALGLALTLSALCGQDARPPLPSHRSEGAATINAAQVEGWLTTLTSEEFGGRGTGQEGFRLAAEMISKHFKDLGLLPAQEVEGDANPYYQVVPWTKRAPDPQETGITLSRDGKEIFSLRVENGLHGKASVSSSVEGDVVIIIADPADSSELEELDLNDKMVLITSTTGFASKRDGRKGRRDMERTVSRYRSAVRRAGGKVIGYIDDGLYKMYGPMQPRSSPGRKASRIAAARGRAPSAFALPSNALGVILKACGVNQSKGATRIDLPGIKAEAKVEMKSSQAPAYNVVAILPGDDPKLREEFVAIGCHLDHLGRSGGGYSPGADDDGSGTVGLMAIAQAFAKNKTRPRRSILFMAFCGEEKGLIGSGYFAKHPLIPLEQIVAELQIDMIGRDEESRKEKAEDNTNVVHLIGSQKLSKDLHEVCIRLNEERAGLDLEWDEEGVFYRSDHWNFAREGVPIAFFFTGFHKDYHQRTDTVEKINFDKLCRIATWVYDIAYELAEKDQRPMVDEMLWKNLSRKGRREPVAPVRKK